MHYFDVFCKFNIIFIFLNCSDCLMIHFNETTFEKNCRT